MATLLLTRAVGVMRGRHFPYLTFSQRSRWSFSSWHCITSRDPGLPILMKSWGILSWTSLPRSLWRFSGPVENVKSLSASLAPKRNSQKDEALIYVSKNSLPAIKQINLNTFFIFFTNFQSITVCIFIMLYSILYFVESDIYAITFPYFYYELTNKLIFLFIFWKSNYRIQIQL